MFSKEKISHQTERETQVVFPDAKEMEKISLSNHPTLTDEAVLAEIMKAAKLGHRYVSLYKSHIMGRTYSDLKSKGYKVELSYLDKEPFVRISW